MAVVRLFVAPRRLSRSKVFCAADQRFSPMDSPARLTTASAPLTTDAQGPLRPFGSQEAYFTFGWAGRADGGRLVSTVTSWLSRVRACVSAVPRKPDPPAMTMCMGQG